MLPIDFKQSNLVFTKPQGFTDEQCMDLPVWKGGVPLDQEKQMNVLISCWKLSKEDMEEIERTGVVWLSVTGTIMPPVVLFTENPFENE